MTLKPGTYKAKKGKDKKADEIRAAMNREASRRLAERSKGRR